MDTTTQVPSGAVPHRRRRLDPTPYEEAYGFQPPDRGLYGLTDEDIEEFKKLIREECGVELTTHEAWNRAVDIIGMLRAFLGTPDLP